MDYNDFEITYKNKDGIDSSCRLVVSKFYSFEVVKNDIENNIVELMVGNDPDYDVPSAKQKLKERLSNDKNNSHLIGAIAEFFMHILIANLGYKRYSIFRNLEDRSFKKGFDGVVVVNDDFWLVESKSTISLSETHMGNIKEAIDCISLKVSCDIESNPWENAISHMKFLQIGNVDPIMKRIKQLEKDRADKKQHDISEYNIIPVSTLFFESTLSEEGLIEAVKKFLTGKKYKNICVVAIDNLIKDSFLKYINE